MAMIVVATNVPEEDGENPVQFGPYEWVQITYTVVRVSPEGDDLLAWSDETGFWHPVGATPIPDSAWKLIGPETASPRRFSDLTVSTMTAEFPLDVDGHPLAWPVPTGGYVDAWNGWYPTRAAALAESASWSSTESSRSRAHGDDLAALDA